MSKQTVNVSSLVVLALTLGLVSLSADATTATGTEFQTIYTKLNEWATGYLGRAIAVAGFIIGAFFGVAKGSPIPALVGVVFAFFMFYVPQIITAIMGAVI
jgi:conjugal transfer pilus assembly protein TraA